MKIVLEIYCIIEGRT